MQLKLNPPEPVGDVGVVDALDEDLPRMCVIIRYARWLGVVLGIEGTRRGSENEGSCDLRAFSTLAQIVGRRHDDFARASVAIARRSRNGDSGV